jgi:hypothetical protein
MSVEARRLRSLRSEIQTLEHALSAKGITPNPSVLDSSSDEEDEDLPRCKGKAHTDSIRACPTQYV